MKIAKEAVRLSPQSTTAWQALGWAHYRTGDWKQSIDALEESCKFQSNRIGDSAQWFYLAMAHWKLGNKDAARHWYDTAVQSETNWPVYRARLRAEAAALLGVKWSREAKVADSPAEK